ncbi:MAG: TolC family protein [Nitrospiraceae bacterium]|nr:TolC family protein [Nitrospiraceae bacterium]
MIILRATILALACTVLAAPAEANDKIYTIDDAYRAALADNENVKIAEEDVIQSESRVDQAWTYLYPQLVAQGAYTRFNETLPPGGGAFLFQPKEQYQASLVLTQPLYTGGRTLAALRTAQKMREASSSGLSLTRQDMMLSVAEAYYGVLKAQKSVDISKRSLERMEHHKETTEREAATRKSKANQSALLRANSLVSQARIALVRAQDGLKIAHEKLSLLTKLPKDIQLAEPEQLVQSSESLENLQKTALSNRADYATSRINKNIADENVTIVQGGHYPQLSALAGAQYQESQPAIFTDATTYYAGLRLTVPIFEGGLMRAEVSEARSKVRQAELSSDFLRKSIESDVEEAYVNLQTVTSVLETAKLEMDYAKGNYEAVDGLFSEGLLASLSLIDAEQALTMAERELMNAAYDRELAILRLRKSIGMLGKEI